MITSVPILEWFPTKQDLVRNKVFLHLLISGNFTNHYYRQKGRFGFLLQIVMTTKQKHNQEDRRKPGLYFPRIEVDNSLPSNVCVTLQIPSHMHC